MLGTIIVGFVLICVVALVIFSLVRKKRAGGGMCSCGCASCPSSGGCTKKRGGAIAIENILG